MNLQQLRFDRDQIFNQIQQISQEINGKNMVQMLAAYSTVNGLRQELIVLQKEILLTLSLTKSSSSKANNPD